MSIPCNCIDVSELVPVPIEDSEITKEQESRTIQVWQHHRACSGQPDEFIITFELIFCQNTPVAFAKSRQGKIVEAFHIAPGDHMEFLYVGLLDD